MTSERTKTNAIIEAEAQLHAEGAELTRAINELVIAQENVRRAQKNYDRAERRLNLARADALTIR